MTGEAARERLPFLSGVKNETATAPPLILDFWRGNIIINIMKTAKRQSSRSSISTHEMRFQFDRVLQAVKAGRTLTLTYRRKPLARIVPLKNTPDISPNDPLFRLHELAEPLGPLTNAEMDAIVYGA